MLKAMVALALLQAAGGTAAERVVQAATPGLKVGFQAANATQSIEERVPDGESVEDWSRMVTTQWLGGLLPLGVTPQAFAEGLAGRWRQSCADAVLSPITSATVGGRQGVEARLDCPLNVSTGKPEVLFLRILAGATDLHSVQVAFRHQPSEEEVAWAKRHLASVRLCAMGGADPGCR